MHEMKFLSGEPYDTLVSKTTMLSMLGGYLLMIAVLRKFMQGQEAYQLKTPMMIYNLAQIFLNIYMIYGLIALPTLTNIFGINAEYTANLEYFCFIHYLSKFLDFFDTAFIILRKKKVQLTFLHVYHHASIGMIWGTLLYIGHGNGTATFGCLINSVIHLMMYSHYFYTSFGFENPFKKIVTKSQLIQFAMCIAHAVMVLAMETVLLRSLAWAQFIYHMQMLFLFGQFYIKTYKKKGDGDAKGAIKPSGKGIAIHND
mmetsp:Transcript_1654/g.3395  ORF Transcript_1654/g.3395 Transcript_1654/m.3395 type:complete len:257 (+) Transcript_1654:211-981(+)|eukprot:CAMPEP_0181342302 /NCGR_PEP_ID=MMETSP1101-20121128/30921_1 /TAXON_ID=46948 /ORGANISM="Rhodomonas abbreviata, Strain Caron Lab Isolate" /LENGTH=256 /DNA_ID=CAMNT_0023453737 /DNA_START=205 /DNA_END=975 /DNA_ORIENTATION=+